MTSKFSGFRSGLIVKLYCCGLRGCQRTCACLGGTTRVGGSGPGVGYLFCLNVAYGGVSRRAGGVIRGRALTERTVVGLRQSVAITCPHDHKLCMGRRLTRLCCCGVRCRGTNRTFTRYVRCSSRSSPRGCCGTTRVCVKTGVGSRTGLCLRVFLTGTSGLGSRGRGTGLATGMGRRLGNLRASG